jgi:hypothetical protein
MILNLLYLHSFSAEIKPSYSIETSISTTILLLMLMQLSWKKGRLDGCMNGPLTNLRERKRERERARREKERERDERESKREKEKERKR